MARNSEIPNPVPNAPIRGFGGNRVLQTDKENTTGAQYVCRVMRLLPKFGELIIENYPAGSSATVNWLGFMALLGTKGTRPLRYEMAYAIFVMRHPEKIGARELRTTRVNGFSTSTTTIQCLRCQFEECFVANAIKNWLGTSNTVKPSPTTWMIRQG